MYGDRAFVYIVVLLFAGALIAPISTSIDDSTSFVRQSGMMKTGKESVCPKTGFQENLGQFPDSSILFYGEIPGGVVGFAEGQIRIRMSNSESPLIISFEGANSVIPEAEGLLSYSSNYLLGSRGTYTQVRSFSTLQYRDLWEGIDLTYRSTDKGAKYEFKVAPGADPAGIRISCEGHRSIISSNSQLRIECDSGVVFDDDLFVYQQSQAIDSRFIVDAEGTFGFEIGSYDHSSSLIIDPLVYGTLFGGSGSDTAKSIAVDSGGNAYVTGETTSLYLPVLNPVNASHIGLIDCFILKLNSTGTGIVFATYVGGISDDVPESIEVDSEGNSVVTGATKSNDFPTINAYDDTYYENWDVFVFKLSADGSSLLYSTYVNGWSDDIGYAVELDLDGNAVVVGTTGSVDFPMVNPYDGSPGSNWDCFVFKLSSTGDSLLFSTYVERESFDKAFDVALDDNENIIAFGQTGSISQPTKAWAFKLNSTGNGMVFSHVYAGSQWDWGESVTVDDSGNAYLAGESQSENYPCDNTKPRGMGVPDFFIMKLNPTGDTIYSRWIAPGTVGREGAIALDARGKIYVTGEDEHEDCFIYCLDPTAESVLYQNKVGGTDTDSGHALIIDSQDTLYVAGTTLSSDFVPLDGYNTTFGGMSDFFVLRFDISGPRYSLDFNPNQPTPGQSVDVSATVTDFSGVQEVTLSYSIDGGSSWNNITMIESAGIWSGVIPAQQLGTTVQFKLLTVDGVGNWAVSSLRTYTVAEQSTTTTTSTTGSGIPMDFLTLGLIGIGAVIVILVIVSFIRKK
jgi:hypothetical protein